MPLNIAKGNMYGFITHTWNPVKGRCPHDCSYCYMRKFWPQMSAPRLDERELHYNLGIDNFIFVGSSIDMWARMNFITWQEKVLNYCNENPQNKYLFQTKNPERYLDHKFNDNHILCITLESNLIYEKYTPIPQNRINAFIQKKHQHKMITIEPVMDFDIDILLTWMLKINPMQINIGADSGNNHLSEPSPEKLKTFIKLLTENRLKVHLKDNLKRLLCD